MRCWPKRLEPAARKEADMARRTFLPLTSTGKASYLAMLGFVIVAPRAVHAQSAALADIVDLVLRKVAVETAKSNGESWDPLGGKPDLRVTLESGAKRFKSMVRSDAFTHDFKVKALRVRPGDIVEIVVRDQDAAVDDEIGRIKVTITAEQIHTGRAVWASFGRVKQLNVEFKR
jgi:hypothetical protein